MLKSSLCHYSDAYILVKVTFTITGDRVDDDAKQRDKRDKGVIFKNQASFTDCISEINHTQVGSAKDLDVVLPMSNLI